jgi:hypothetical protein
MVVQGRHTERGPAVKKVGKNTFRKAIVRVCREHKRYSETETKCPECGGRMVKRVRWICNNCAKSYPGNSRPYGLGKEAQP